MPRILPITILFLAAFVAFKAYSNKDTDLLQDSFGGANSERVELDSALNLQAIEPAAGEEAAEEEVAAEEDEPKEGEAAVELPEYVSKERPEESIPELTKSGIGLLKQMAERRKELEEWKADLDLRASLIEASSRKLDDKIGQLETLKANTEKLLAEYKVEDNAKIKSMVKIYENMKPKEAAKVFDQLDMPVLLEIVEQMNERRVSPILAKMNAARARDLTEKLVSNRDLAKM